MPGSHVPIRTRTEWADEAGAVKTLDQNGTGPNLHLRHETQPEQRWEEEDQTDPAGRYSAIVNGDVLTFRRAATANWATFTTLWQLDSVGWLVPDDVPLGIGTSRDTALINVSAGLAINTADTGNRALVGTPVTPVAPAANSLLLGNITASGDILIAVNKAGTSHMAFMADASTGDTIVQASTGQSFDVYIAGVKEIDYATGALAFQQATTISTTATTLTLSPATDVIIADGKGFYVGATAGVLLGGTGYRVQVLGDGTNDFALVVGNWESSAVGPLLAFVKSRHDTIGSFTAVSSGDTLGSIYAYADDGFDYNSIAAEIRFSADGAAGSNDTPGRIVFLTTLGGAATVTERMRINNAGVIILGRIEGGTTAATGTTLRAPDITTGGAGNIAGADLTIAAGLGTGTGDEGTVIFSLPIVAAAGDNIQTTATRLTLDMAGSSTLLSMVIAQDMTITGGNLLLGGTLGLTGTRVSNIFTTSQTTTNAETVDSWGRTKQNIQDYDDALAVVRSVQVVSYEHLLNYDPTGRRKLGVLAESVREAMVTPLEEYEGLGLGPRLDMLGLAALNTRAIQQVDAEVALVKDQIAVLEERLRMLEAV